MEKINSLSLDLETFSDVDLNKCGVYKYAQSSAFEILLFGVSVNGGEVQVYDLAQRESVPMEIIKALMDNSVLKWAFNASFERVCLSVWLQRYYPQYFESYSIHEDTVGDYLKLIYKLFLDGMTMHTIAGELTKRGIKTPGGKDKWNQSTVRSILTNEKYKGDALLQKSYTVDFLTKKTKTNEGEVPQYYVENNHEAIIDPQIFELVQAEIAKRN